MIKPDVRYKCSNCYNQMFRGQFYCPICGSPAHWEKFEEPNFTEYNQIRLGFSVIKCIQNTNHNDAFVVGEYYPVMGTNNGIQIVGERKDYGGDAVVVLCGTYGDPEDGNGYEEDMEDEGLRFRGYKSAYYFEDKDDKIQRKEN